GTELTKLTTTELAELTLTTLLEARSGGDVALVDRRPQRREALRLDGRPRQVQRFVQVPLERHPPARGQHPPHRLPILVRRVLDDGEPLHRRLAALLQQQAIARLPDRMFEDVADLHAPLAGPAEVQADRALLRVVHPGKDVERLLKLGVERRVEEAQPA